jgi:hypothetical protein
MLIKSVQYQRNGISGIGFHQFAITWEGRDLIAVLFDHESKDCLVAVMDPTDLTSCYRGDVAEPFLKAYLARLESEYNIVAVSQNTNSFGLRQHIMINRWGDAYRFCSNGATMRRGQVLTLEYVRRVGELVERVVRAGDDIAAEVWGKDRFRLKMA